LFSHFEIACDDIPMIPARFSCVRPLSLRSSAIFSPNVFIFYRSPYFVTSFFSQLQSYYISNSEKCTDIIGRVIPTVTGENQPTVDTRPSAEYAQPSYRHALFPQNMYKKRRYSENTVIPLLPMLRATHTDL